MPARFSILDIPGSGAHATVCIARDQSNGEVRALKVLRKSFAPDSSEARRVRDEGKILARLSHPALPQVYEQLELAGRQVLVMDFVNGPSVAWLVRRLGPLPADVALAIARQVALAVDHAYSATGEGGHPARLVHRDLNLSNVLIDCSGAVKVLDFGMARAEFADREASTMISLRGTPGYTAPEGLRSIPDNPGLDVYSLGIGLLLMLTGHLPVLSRKPQRHADGLSELIELLAAKTQDPRLPPLIRSMCAFHPGARPTMRDVAEALEDEDPDILTRFATTDVQRLHGDRKRVDPLVHGSYEELAFLEQVNLGETSDNPAERADHIVRRFLERANWADHPADLKWILARYPAWTAAPFLDVLNAARVPWWTLKRSKVPPLDLATALCAASHRPSAAVVEIAERLCGNRHPEVAAIATEVVAGKELALERAADVERGR